MLSLSDDLLRNLSVYLTPIELIRTSKFGCKVASWRFPRKITLNGVREIRQFENICQILDTDNLEEVTMITNYIDRSRKHTEVIGWVPPTVKTLNVDNYGNCIMRFPRTIGIQNLTIDNCNLEYIAVPDSVINLTLKSRFEGSILLFPPNLQTLKIQNWSWLDYPNEHSPPIPDTVREIYIGSFVPFNVFQWPTGLVKLTCERCDHSFVPEYPPVPEGVDFALIGEPDFGNEEDWWDDNDDYDNDYDPTAPSFW